MSELELEMVSDITSSTCLTPRLLFEGKRRKEGTIDRKRDERKKILTAAKGGDINKTGGQHTTSQPRMRSDRKW